MLALIYELVDDYVERRAPLRDDHLGLIRAAHDRGELYQAGALSDPFDRALIIWRGDDTSLVEAFVAADPYMTNGLVTSYSIRTWNTVI